MHSLPPQQQSKQSQKQKGSLQADNNQYHLYQIVWAKVTGYPWWPGKIISLAQSPSQNEQAKNKNNSGRKRSNEQKHTVLFIKQGSISFLDQSKIRPYVVGQDPPGVEDHAKMSKQWQQSKRLFDRQLKLAMQFYKNNSQQSFQIKQRDMQIQQPESVQKSNQEIFQQKQSIEDYQQKQKLIRTNGKKSVQNTPRKTSVNQLNKSSQRFTISRRKGGPEAAKRDSQISSFKSIQIQKQDSKQQAPKQKNLRKTYLDILTRKGFQRRKALSMVSKILTKSTNLEFNILEKLGEQQIIKLLKQKTVQQLEQILL